MRFSWADAPAAPGSWLLLALGLASALFAGMLTAVVGGMAGERAIYYVAVFGVIVIGAIVTVTRKEPLRFAFLVSIGCFPIAGYVVPPGRIGLVVFEVIMLGLMLGLIGRKASASSTNEPLFPTKSLLIAWLFVIPCVVFSQFPLTSLVQFILYFSLYTFFLLALSELRRHGGFERIVLLLSIVLLFLAIALFIDHFLHVNLMLRGTHLNQSTYAAGLEVWRARGFFADPQIAGAFFACVITFLLLLAVRGRFSGLKMRFVVWAAIAVGSVAMVTTIARSAIMACLLVSGLALFAFNKWNAAAKLALTGGMTVLAIVMALLPSEIWLNIVPETVAARFASLHWDLEMRRKIWFDTWNMFADHPLAGIGLSSFQPYLMQTRPTVFNYYGMGEAAGVPYIPSQPESGYLKILYEGGIAGSAAVLLVVADTLRRAVVLIASPRTHADARTESIAAVAALVTFGLTFITLFTASDPRIAALCAFLLAVIWRRSLQRSSVA